MDAGTPETLTGVWFMSETPVATSPTFTPESVPEILSTSQAKVDPGTEGVSVTWLLMFCPLQTGLTVRVKVGLGTIVTANGVAAGEGQIPLLLTTETLPLKLLI